MMRVVFALVALALALALPLTAQQRPAGTSETRAVNALRESGIWAPLRFLSSDALEGRGTGARGGDIAAQYLASQFMALGLEPAGDSGTYFHQVPIVTLVPDGQLSATGSPRALRYRDDFVLWSETPAERPRAAAASHQTADATGELVFVGFGISAPEWQWDDYQALDVRGKILLMLVNDPGLRDPAIFRGRILTYYGRWTYKLEEAARRGAAGVLLLHNDTMATYGWSTVRNSWTGDQVRLLSPATSLAWAGWITQSAATELLATKGIDLTQAMATAARRDFRPIATGIAVTGRVQSAVRFSNAANVVGHLPGSDPVLRDQSVLITAHYDHLGIGQPVGGDSIMNGAVDNASGTAALIAMADAFARSGVRPRRSLVFAAFTGEEQGLLGSKAFAQRPPQPLASYAAVLNIDVTNLYAATRDVAALGTDQSTLGRYFDAAARAEGLRVTTDSGALFRGSYFRSDHFPLARVGVPGLSWESGEDALGHPAGWMKEQLASYNRDRYHQPSDELLPWYVMGGTLQQVRVLMRVALAVGNAAAQPTWNASSEFRAAGEERLRH
jgi:Zn-dependent M28 family amino/carboxypeptidase